MTRFPTLALAFAVALAALPTYARADGLIVIPNPPPPLVHGHFTFAPLEVVYHKVECDIKDQVAITSVDQEFFNPNSAILEGEYLFPVPKDARIDKFTMDIDGKPVEAELLPADKARAIYTEIVRKTKDPALLEYAGRELFKVRIYPIEAQGKKRIRLKYTQLLKSDNGLLDYHYTLNTEKFSAKPLKNVSIKVTVNSGEPLTTLYSPTHDVDISRKGDKEAVVGYEAKNVRPDTDFHLYIGRKAGPVGISVLTFRPDSDKEGYFVLLATPTINEAVKPLPKDVIFVLDTSGSMSGDKIEQARKALTYCVQTLNKEDRFNVIRFSTEAEPLFEGLQEASPENRKKATEFAANLRAAGGTAIDEALQKALGNYAAWLPPANDGRPVRMLREVPTHLPLVVFLTDGQPTVGEQNPDKILQHVKDKMGDAQIRIFSFGVGNDVNTKLLDLVAEQTRGYSQYVLPNENLELSMSNFWGKVQDPVLANLKVTAGADFRLTQLYPSDLPDLFKGDQLVAFGTYTKAGSTAITLTGTAGGKEQTFAQDVTFADKTGTDNEWIARLWATRRVGYLLDQIRLHGENKELKDEVVNLSRRWGVVTPYTAMLIIEDEQKRNVPVAQRTMREMEFDQKASSQSNDALFALRRKEATGGMSVSNSVNTAGYRAAKTLEDASMAAAQTDSRTSFAGQAGAAMSRAGEYAPAAPAGGGGFGGTASPVASTPVDKSTLNLGTKTSFGWQVAADPAKDTGYRVVNNYAQQTRVVNNRSFFLNGNQWTEARLQTLPPAKPVKIVFNSDDYFALLAAHPEASAFLSLGSNVTLELAGTVYDIVEEAVPPPTPR